MSLQVMYLSPWPPEHGAVCGGYGTFMMQNLAEGSMALRDYSFTHFLFSLTSWLPACEHVISHPPAPAVYYHVCLAIVDPIPLES